MRIDENNLRMILIKFGMGGEVLIQRLQSIIDKAFEYKQELQKTNPKWDIELDARHRVLGKCIAICNVTQFKLNILAKMIDDDCYRDLVENEIQLEEEYKNILISNFESSTKFNFGISMFTLIENYFRIFLRSIDQEACNGATKEFKSIYECLIGRNQLRILDSEKENAFALLELVRNIRNLIHNDGGFFSQNGLDTVVNYQEKSYVFQNGKMANFVTWDLLLVLAKEILELLITIISHPKINNIAEIEDPFMNYK